MKECRLTDLGHGYCLDFKRPALVKDVASDDSNVTRPAFTTMAMKVRALNLPIVIVQEGGYESEILGHLIADVLEVFDC